MGFLALHLFLKKNTHKDIRSVAAVWKKSDTVFGSTNSAAVKNGMAS
jgi:hypothetical protein